MREKLSRIALSIPALRRLRDDRNSWRSEARRTQKLVSELEAELEFARNGQASQFAQPGHFYSPIVSLSDVDEWHERLFNRTARKLPGIDVDPDRQLALLPVFERYYAEQPFSSERRDGLRYAFENDFFSYGDGLALYGMLRHLAPRRVIEVGSGWSSALMLDVNERFFGGRMEFTFIEPHPGRLYELLRQGDATHVRIIDKAVQSVDDDVFAQLRAGDLLFIDSTHVAKTGSDVNRLFLDVIPTLAPGVHIHVHDVFWPFEYPESWVYEGRSWNESYLLRSLLIGNRNIEVSWFNAYLAQFHAVDVAKAMPLWQKNTGGSIYLTTR